MTSLSENLRPPYYAAVIAPHGDTPDSSARLAIDELISIAPKQDGFLGLETGRTIDGRGATVCYWTSPSAIQGWKSKVLRQLIQELNLKHRRLEDACDIEVTRIVKRLFGRKTPLTVTFMQEQMDQRFLPVQGRAA